MLKTQISLLGIILLVIFIETVVVPGIWSQLRVDLFLGMVIGVIIHLGFSQGLAFVMVSSILLQAFSSARPGLLPLFYLFVFISIEILKDIIYLENLLTQMGLAGTFFVLAAVTLAAFLDVSMTLQEALPLVAGTMITGAVSPLMAALVGRVKKAYEA